MGHCRALKPATHYTVTVVANWVRLMDSEHQSDKISVDKNQKMPIDFSPQTVDNTVTNHTTLTSGENKFKIRDRNEIGFRGQFSARGFNSCSLTNSTSDSNACTGNVTIIVNNRLTNNY